MTAQHSTRDRLVYSAVQHLRRHGTAAAGLRQVVADAAAPWGSFRHYFPGGKPQLMAEALDWSGRFAAGKVSEYDADAGTPAGLYAHLTDFWVGELERRDYSRGCPLVGVVSDDLDEDPTIRAAAANALATWRTPIVDALTTMALSADRAAATATLMLCTLEGAIILARADRSTAPLHTARDALAPALTVTP